MACNWTGPAGLTTYCEDTPENWAHFHRLKERLGRATSRRQEVAQKERELFKKWSGQNAWKWA